MRLHQVDPLPDHVLVYRTPRGRKTLTELHREPEGTTRGPGRWYWLFWSGGTHRVGLFSEDQCVRILEDHALQGHTIRRGEAPSIAGDVAVTPAPGSGDVAVTSG